MNGSVASWEKIMNPWVVRSSSLQNLETRVIAVMCNNELSLIHTGMQRCGSSKAGECNPAGPILEGIVSVERPESIR